MRWHEDVVRDDVLAAVPCKPSRASVVNLEIRARHNDVNRRPMRRRVGASQDYQCA